MNVCMQMNVARQPAVNQQDPQEQQQQYRSNVRNQYSIKIGDVQTFCT